jgi:hypothetical protein
MLKSKKGSVLIVLIITMTIMAVLGAAMAVFLASSSLTELYLNQANQAQYLAESGIRFGHSSTLFTIPTTTYSLANVPGQIKISKTVNNYIISTGIINQGTQNQMRTISWGPGSGTNGTKRPPHNIAALSASSATSTTLLAALDTSGTVAGQVSNTSLQVANGGCAGGETFVTFQNITPAANPETSGCNIGCQMGYLVVPLLNSTTDSNNPVKKMRDTWTTYSQLSYDVQVKVSWVINNNNTPNTADTAQGINIRWHESATPGKYEGYGISFMEYRSRISCSAANLDYLPCNVKPCVGNPCGNDNTLAAKLLLVLWQQKVVGGIETKTWLAYANLGNPAAPLTTPGDPKVLGGQNAVDSLYVNDNASMVIRIEDKTSFTGIRYNDIKIYYGEDSTEPTRTIGTRGFDAAATNINHGAYAPVCAAATWTPSWPSNAYEPYTDNPPTLTYWSYSGWWPQTTYAVNNVVIPDFRTNTSDNSPHNYRCTTAGTSGTSEPTTWPASGTVSDGTVTWQENGTARPTSYDYFTIGSANPVIDTHTVSLTVNSAVVNDVSTNLIPAATVILLSDRATIRTYDFILDTFSTTRPEIALHAMGYLDTTRGYLGFADLAIRILGKAE